MPIPLVSLYTDNIPSRSEPLTFRVDGDNFNAYFGVIGVDINATATAMNETATQVDLDATSAAASAATSASSANFIGEWDTNPDGTPRTGALNVPVSVSHLGSTWQLLSDIADVTVVEPSVSAVWQVITGSPWQDPKTSNFNIIAGNGYQVDGSGGTVDGSLPAVITAKQEFIIHNESISTNLVRVLNANFSIKGAGAVLLAGDNLILKAGDTVHMVARSSLILEIV